MAVPLKTKFNKRGSFSPDFLLQKGGCTHHNVAPVCVWKTPSSSFSSRRPVITNVHAHRITLLEGISIMYFLISNSWQ